MVRRWYGDGGGRGRGSIVCAQGGRGGDGRGNLRVAKTPPLQPVLRGGHRGVWTPGIIHARREPMRTHCLPIRASCIG